MEDLKLMDSLLFLAVAASGKVNPCTEYNNVAVQIISLATLRIGLNMLQWDIMRCGMDFDRTAAC